MSTEDSLGAVVACGERQGGERQGGEGAREYRLAMDQWKAELMLLYSHLQVTDIQNDVVKVSETVYE